MDRHDRRDDSSRRERFKQAEDSAVVQSAQQSVPGGQPPNLSPSQHEQANAAFSQMLDHLQRADEDVQRSFSPGAGRSRSRHDYYRRERRDYRSSDRRDSYRAKSRDSRYRSRDRSRRKSYDRPSRSRRRYDDRVNNRNRDSGRNRSSRPMMQKRLPDPVTPEHYASLSKFLKTKVADEARAAWLLRSEYAQQEVGPRISPTSPQRERIHHLHENYLRTFGPDIAKRFGSLESLYFQEKSPNESPDLFSAAHFGASHPFDVEKTPSNLTELLLEMNTGMTAKQRAVNDFYGAELKSSKEGPPLAPVQFCHRSRRYIPKPNWDVRQACNPVSCKITGSLKNRRIPTSEWTRAIEFLVKTHDSARIPPTDDPVKQSIHLIRRSCSEMVIFAEGLNECMLAVSNICAGLPEESWFIPVLLRWRTIRAYLDDSLNGINSTARMYSGKLTCRTAKRFQQLFRDRQKTLPLPENFAKTDSSLFVPGPDFAFMSTGPGAYKTKASFKVLDPSLEAEADPGKGNSKQ